MAGSNKNDIFGNASLFQDFLDDVASKPQVESGNDGHGETLNQLKEKLDGLKQENGELRRQLRLLIHPSNFQAGTSNHTAPLAQVLFFNHEAVGFHRHQIEDFFENLTSLKNGDSGSVGVPDNVRPKPQRSSRPLREDLVGTMSEKAFRVIGNVQYYQRFCLDSLGRPLVDGNPQLTTGWNIPYYSVIFHEALPPDETENPSQNRAKRSKATCWNCGKEEHSLRDCPFARDLVKISMAKKEFMEQNAENTSLKQRYHKEGEEGADQRFNKFRAGQISHDLREALGLDKHQIPPYIYQMRLLGYPPGYLKHAEVIKSGLTVYDIKDGDEPGQIKTDEADGQPTYDSSKLIEYPGFNVPLPDGVRDPQGVPPMQPAHSKDAFQLFMTPPRGDNNGRKRGRRDFAKDPEKKPPQVEREDVDMDLEGDTPDVGNRAIYFSMGLEGTAEFKPPLPPTPVPETPPPLPSSTPPVTPSNTPRFALAESSGELQGVESRGGVSTDVDADNTSQSSATPHSMSPSMDDLQIMQSRLREALMQAAEEGGGSSVLSDADNTSERFVLDGEEFIVDSVSGDEAEEMAGAVQEVPEHSTSPDEEAHTLDKVGYEPRTSEGEDVLIADKEECEPRILENDRQSGALTGGTSAPTPCQNVKNTQSAAAEWKKLETAEGADDLEPGEITDHNLDATPNRSGVPHISKFAVGISPHENENMSETTGMLNRILGIFKRKKGTPSSSD